MIKLRVQLIGFGIQNILIKSTRLEIIAPNCLVGRYINLIMQLHKINSRIQFFSINIILFLSIKTRSKDNTILGSDSTTKDHVNSMKNNSFKKQSIYHNDIA